MIERWPDPSSPVFVAHVVAYASSNGFAGRSRREEMQASPDGGAVNGC
jgi:hypothetical protein